MKKRADAPCRERSIAIRIDRAGHPGAGGLRHWEGIIRLPKPVGVDDEVIGGTSVEIPDHHAEWGAIG